MAAKKGSRKPSGKKKKSPGLDTLNLVGKAQPFSGETRQVVGFGRVQVDEEGKVTLFFEELDRRLVPASVDRFVCLRDHNRPSISFVVDDAILDPQEEG